MVGDLLHMMVSQRIVYIVLLELVTASFMVRLVGMWDHFKTNHIRTKLIRDVGRCLCASTAIRALLHWNCMSGKIHGPELRLLYV